RAAAQRPHLPEVEPRRRQQIGAVVVLVLEDPPDEREAVRVDACRGKADHDVASLDGRAVDELPRLDDADARPGEVELTVAVDPRQLRRLAADERDARLPADGGGA